MATTRTELGKTYTTYYFYDTLQRLIRLIYPDSRVVTYARDTRGHITDVSATVNGTTTPIATARIFQADGQLSSQSFGNGLTETRNYDPQGRLADQALGSLDSRLLDYDANANLTRVQGTAQTGDYLYDPLDRLSQDKITTTTTSTNTFGYDKNGNRTKLGSTVYGYTAGSNKLVAVGSTSLTLDVAGNTRTKGTWGYYYNQAGQLNQAYNGTTLRATYTYNHLGQRTRKVAGSTTTVYHYDLAGNLILETSNTAATRAAYVWADDQPLAHIQRSGTTDRLSYLHTDHLNTPRLASDTAARIVWRWDGRAFGNTTPNNNPDGDTITTTINLRFPGQYYDSETGFHYNYFRYYDPSTGRYITSDPVGLDGGLNTYTYVESNPLYRIDPLGLAATAPIPAPVTIPGFQLPTPNPWWMLIWPRPAGEGSDTVPQQSSIWDELNGKVPDSAADDVSDKPNCPPSGDNDDGDRCYKNYINELSTCRAIGRFRGLAKAEACYASATERLAACRAGRPIPPLNTWNN